MHIPTHRLVECIATGHWPQRSGKARYGAFCDRAYDEFWEKVERRAYWTREASLSFLLVHLTDMHFVTETDPVLSRVDQIAGAIIAETDPGTEAIHLVLGGDAAQSATPEQFAVAERFVKTLVDRLAAIPKPVPLEVIAVPGNHDCDLSGDEAMRELAIERVYDLLRDDGVPAKSAEEVLLAPLKGYFGFAGRVAPGASHSTDAPYYRVVEKKAGSTTVAYHLFNTAWMSRRSDVPGSLAFPLGACESAKPGGVDVSVCVLHHPFNWFRQPQTLRALREKVESLGDLILSGHEHVEQVFGKQIHGVGGIQYIEGAVLQERARPDVSGFHVIRVDAPTKTATFSTYAWKSGVHGHYERRLGPVSARWDAVAERTSRLRLRARFAQHLNDPGLPVHHRSRGPLRLSDFYTYPDLGSMGDDINPGIRVRGDRVVQNLLERQRVIIVAPDKAGRTSFAKRLFTDLHSQGYAPLLLSGNKLPQSGRSETVRDRLHDAIREQYETIQPEAYEQLAQHQRVLIVDDLHKAPREQAVREACLKDLDNRFGRVILLASHQFYLDELLVRSGSDEEPAASVLDEYDCSILLPFGFGRCEQFIRNWVALSPDDDTNTPDERVRQILGTVDGVLRSSAIPHHPWIVLVLVQMADSPEAPIAENGSYGHLLNGIVTAALNRLRVKRLPINGLYGYLGELARTIFERGGSGIPEDEARAFHTRYTEAMGLSGIEFNGLIDDLCETAILERWGGEVLFQHKYTFCFFVAWSLAQRLNDNQSGAMDCVRSLSKNLFKEDSADVIVFLAHLTSNRAVLAEIKQRATELFTGATPTDFESDVQHINQLSKTVRSIVLLDGDPEENRRQLHDRQDDAAARSDPTLLAGRSAKPQPPEVTKTEQDATYQGIMQVTSALRTIEILGQVLRNGATVRTLDEKSQIASEIFLLARRLLGFLYQATPAGLPNLIARLEESYRHRFPEAEDREIADDVSEHIFNLNWFFTFAVIKHVANAVGDEHLEDTFKRVLRRGDGIHDRLFDIAIRLDQPVAKLPLEPTKALLALVDRNHLAVSVLRSLVVEHLYVYRVHEQDKQSVCQMLDIKMSARMFDNKEKKLLS